MSVSTTSNRIVYTGNGSTTTPYPVPFRVLAETDIQVSQRTNLEPNAEWNQLAGSFTVTLIEETGTAEVRTFAAWDSENEIQIVRIVPITQPAEYPISGPFPAKSHEQALDRATMIDQQHAADIANCLKLRTRPDQTENTVFPQPTTGVLGYDTEGIPQIYSAGDLATLLDGSIFVTEDGDVVLSAIEARVDALEAVEEVPEPRSALTLPKRLADRYNKTSWEDLSDFTVVGTSPTIVNGAIRMTAAFGNWNTQRIMLPEVRAERDYTIIVRLRFNALTGYGIAIGKTSVNGWGYLKSAACTVTPSVSYNAAIYSEFSGSITGPTISAVPPVVAVGQLIEIRMTSRRSVVTNTITNLETGEHLILSTTAETNCGRIGIANIGSNVDIVEIGYTADAPPGSSLLVIGDSKTAGSPGDNHVSWADRLSPARNVTILAGSADTTVEMVQAINDFDANGATDAVICIGRNDLAAGVSSVIWQSNLATIVAAVESSGITNVIFLVVPETTQNQTALTSHLTSVYPGYTRLYLPSYNIGTMESGDLVHPNTVGATYTAREVEPYLSAAPIPQGDPLIKEGRLDGRITASNLQSLGTLSGLTVGGNATVTGNAVFGTLGASGTSTATPNTFSLGSKYGSSAAGNRANCKFYTYQDTGGNVYGIGQTSTAMEYYAATGGGFGWWSGTSNPFNIGPSAVGFYGTAAVTQPAAIAGTSGLTLGNLELEVNKVKTALRTLGLIAT